MRQRILFSWLIFLLLGAVAAIRAGDAVNVRDFGASGSAFETTATTVVGAQQITVADVGDFKVGQGVAVSRCNIQYKPVAMWGVGQAYFNAKEVGDSVEVRGYDGSSGSWPVHLLDIAPGKTEFRWTDDLGRTWHPETAITHDWQPLSGGIEVRLGKRDWESGYVIALRARDQLITTIEKIEGKVITLKDAPNRATKEAVVRHNDNPAIQEAIQVALREKRNVFLPVGRYRMAKGVMIRSAKSLVMEGQSATETILDISDGEGSCIELRDGEDVTLRNLRMEGFMGFDQADQAGGDADQGSQRDLGNVLSPLQCSDDTEHAPGFGRKLPRHPDVGGMFRSLQ